MWQTDTFGAVTVWLATSDGFQSSDVFYSLPGAHMHYNFGLTAPGTYEVDLQASAYLQYPNNQTFSAVTTYTFCVDDVDNGDPPTPIPPPPRPFAPVSRIKASWSELPFKLDAREFTSDNYQLSIDASRPKLTKGDYKASQKLHDLFADEQATDFDKAYLLQGISDQKFAEFVVPQ